MESSHLVIFSTSGKFITKFNVSRYISLRETLFWTRARARIPISLIFTKLHCDRENNITVLLYERNDKISSGNIAGILDFLNFL